MSAAALPPGLAMPGPPAPPPLVEVRARASFCSTPGDHCRPAWRKKQGPASTAIQVLHQQPSSCTPDAEGRVRLRRCSSARLTDNRSGMPQLFLSHRWHAACIVALPLLAGLRPPHAGVALALGSAAVTGGVGAPLGWAAGSAPGRAACRGGTPSGAARRSGRRRKHADACAHQALRDWGLHRPGCTQRSAGRPRGGAWRRQRLLLRHAGRRQRLEVPHGQRAVGAAGKDAIQLLRPAASVSAQGRPGGMHERQPWQRSPASSDGPTARACIPHFMRPQPQQSFT